MKVTITPEVAAVMLSESGTVNYRKLDARRVAQYAAMMKAGRWEYNGETITRDPDGVVRNGNHRLHACVLAQVPFTTELVDGITSTSEVDRGKSRSLSDALVHEGISNAFSVACLCTWLWKYSTNQMVAVDRSLPINEGVRLAKIPAVAVGCEYFAHSPSIVKYGGVGWLMVLTLMVDDGETDAATFWDEFKSGVGLVDGDARLLLRARLANNRGSHAKLSPTAIAAMAIKTFNAYLQDRTLRTLKWSRLNANKEAFPEILNLPPRAAAELLDITIPETFAKSVAPAKRHIEEIRKAAPRKKQRPEGMPKWL